MSHNEIDFETLDSATATANKTHDSASESTNHTVIHNTTTSTSQTGPRLIEETPNMADSASSSQHHHIADHHHDSKLNDEDKSIIVIERFIMDNEDHDHNLTTSKTS